jgi:ribosomal protein S6--L-glutamate ligase
VSYPLVIKSNYGGGGSLVYKARDHRHARECLREIGQMEARGFHGALVQEWVEGAGRTLRVAVIHRRFFSYWRVQENPHRFLHNRAAGARTDSSSDPGLQLRGVKLVRELIRKTGIELAGFDVLFSGPEAEPLLLEINYHFARDGLGGNDAYYRLLQSSVDEWLRRRGLRYSRKHPVRA